MKDTKARAGGKLPLAPSGRHIASNEQSRTIRIPKAAQIVAGHIRKMILRGELNEDDRLEPEGQMVTSFGISRPTLREAIRILETEHFIDVSRGTRTGPRVRKPRAEHVARYAGFALQAQGTTLGEIYAARLAIEPYVARQLAIVKPRKNLQPIRQEIARAQELIEAQDQTAFYVATARLHRSLVALLGNGVLLLFIDLIEEILERHQGRQGRNRGSRNTRDVNEVRKANRGAVRSFEKVLDLIEAGDADGADAHWRRHIENANASWLLGVDQTAIVDILD